MAVLVIMAQWLGILGLFFLAGWLLFRLGWMTWDESAESVVSDAADGSGGACAGGGGC